MASLLTQIKFHSTLASGADNASGKVLTYAAGTLTPLATYTDQGGGTPNATTVILDSTGRANIWLAAGSYYKFIVQDSTGASTPDGTVDYIGAAVSGPDIGNTSNVALGDALIGQKRTYSGAVATTPHAWHEKQIIDVVADGGADDTGVNDCTAAFQAAITAGSVRFKPGTYKMAGDVTIPSDRVIIVEKGATITNTGGRFTSYNTSNVEWIIDGWVNSVAMTFAADKTGWYAGERGFIEFGMAYSAGQASSGFWVHGTGIVSGDWTGTPNFSDPANQINRKGICCWNSKNVTVEGLEVYGFNGEAIYAFCIDTASININFRYNNVHDTRFNALNFNATVSLSGCSIHHNRAVNTFQIETSSGDCSDNYIETTPTGSPGIYTGVGAGGGPMTIRRNTIKGAGLHSIAASFASGSPVTDVVIENNVSINPAAYGIYTDYCRELSIHGNTCIGTGQTSGSYDIGVNHGLRGTIGGNTFMSPGASAQPGRIALDVNTFDVAVDPNTNVYIATTGTATPAGNAVGAVTSATATSLPVLGSIFLVTTGVTPVTSIVATGCAGRTVVLVFAGVLTLTDGSNLKLAGNFVTTADDSITLVCDGTNWYEVCRSVN